ncbi:RagB/SusD family nutrient uptake outer membrane protein [Zunongwangia sp.]|uniref:RagB/SusD family nutrient uptake outer membrane protein n=1 Tax=Zunongwangia sp. TaxID=1965325 RepID=UPI003AA94694
MKKSIYTSSLALLLIGTLVTGCEDLLEETNRTKITIPNSRENPETFDRLLNYTYEISRNNTTRYAPDMLYVLEDLGTDIVTRSSPLNGTDAINDYVDMNASNYVMWKYWENQYKIISAANNLIYNADLIEGVEENVRTKGVGEAKFFRAWSYFKLVENYGGVPIVTEPITTAQSDFTRVEEQEVYALIVNDLNDAINAVDENPADYGRVSKDAARHLLSKVLLTRGYKSFAAADDYDSAISLAETVIANHPLEPTFADVIDIENQRNDEVIFSYLFGSDPLTAGWGNTKHLLYKFEYFNYSGLERGTLYQNGIGRMPTPYFFNMFDEEDTRNEETLRYVLYADVAEDGLEVGDTAIYFPKTAWSQERIDSKPYTVINPDEYLVNDGVTNIHFPMFKKFDDPGAPFVYANEKALGDRDMVMMRGAEAYLIAAEAAFQKNDLAAAANYLNTVRSRAGITTPLTAADIDIAIILEERARELIGEVNRWMDLKRTGTLISRVLEYNPHAALNNAISEKNLLRPIPQPEIDASGNSISQNPGY